MKLKVMKMYPDVKLPEYATDGSACFDICAHGAATFDGVWGTGLKFEIPENHVMLVFSRSGHGFKYNTRLANCVGVIDSDYRGELKVKLISDNMYSTFHLSKGDRIAQAMLIPVNQVQFEEVTSVGITQRGEAGLGSTG